MLLIISYINVPTWSFVLYERLKSVNKIVHIQATNGATPVTQVVF